ncbi:siderophore-interacting protein [Bosea caraganae]|uniref:Siderophore-interacting protein n=1 Tax=Bosea caraganae TaxID=2763117 RepID=A0A370L8E7_9HYPH|nr:siderophore-interacting protein [Bosea caraganae]RDJ26660.1 siderophore-interacting protein [Bosea caraganae]RDJ30547.1 siderophore-interacting protein [Bosea caraganae]
MAEAQMLIATTRVALADPRGLHDKLCGHFVEHGTVSRSHGSSRLDGPFGAVLISEGVDALDIRVEAPSEGYLFVVKSSVAEHLVAFAEGEAPVVAWNGDRAAATEIPYFRAMTVRGARDVTPKMRRVTLAGDIAHFETGGLHVRVLIPPKGHEPRWPSVGRDGRVAWPKGRDELVARVYTIRRLDRASGELAIDVVLHEDSAGSVWARTAQEGDPIGLMGPGGGEIVPADWYLLCGDETALPAIARIAESLPTTARATILLEIADAGEEQPIASAATLDLRWLHRNGAEPGTTDLLETAIRAVDWPAEGEPYVLAGCEQKAARAIRGYLRKERGLARERHLVAAYWRRGHEGVLPERD